MFERENVISRSTGRGMRSETGEERVQSNLLRNVLLRTTGNQSHRGSLRNMGNAHKSCPTQGGRKARMFVLHLPLPLAEVCSLTMGLPHIQIKRSHRQRIASTSSEVGLYWIIPEYLEGVWVRHQCLSAIPSLTCFLK